MIKNCFKYVKKMSMSQKKYIQYLRNRGILIGEGCDIAKNVNFGSEPWLISIGNNVRITQKVQFITHDGGIWTLRKMGMIDSSSVKFGNIVIGDNCNISWNVIIMPNVKIGDNCVIAAGAVVTKSVPSGEVWGGIPAKKIETIEEYYNKIKKDVLPTFGMSEKDKKEYIVKYKPELLVKGKEE